MSDVASVRAVFGTGKAIRSTTPGHGTVWFYRSDDREIFARQDSGGVSTVSVELVERNIDHEQSEVETVPLDDLPFDV